MASFFEKKDRHVIPNWRSFDNTAKLGELNGSKGIQLTSTFRPDISDLLDDWEDSNSIGIAGDILGVALLANQERNPRVQEIAKFVEVNPKLASKAIMNAAKQVLNSDKPTELNLNFDADSLNTFQHDHLFTFHQEIALLKRKLRQNSYNPILWIEMSRLHAILGQDKKAERAIRNAIFLAPENRFVLRNSARFFTHLKDFEFAHDIIRRSQLVKTDPWVMASEISLATLRGRESKFIKSGLQLVESNTFHPFNISELASSLATVEMKNNSVKRSRKLFARSLEQPNDNSLAQAEWAEQQDTALLPINPKEFQVINSFEALARDAAQHMQWNDAIKFSMQWFIDLPFSKTSLMFGNEVARKNLKDHRLAVEIAQAGLVSHPHDAQLINNIVYSLCLQNKLEHVDQYFSRIRRGDIQPNSIHDICVTATRGLYAFRKGNYNEGRLCYLESMRKSKESDDVYLNNLAFVNYCREESRIAEFDCRIFLPRLRQIQAKTNDSELAEEANEVITKIDSLPMETYKSIPENYGIDLHETR